MAAYGGVIPKTKSVTWADPVDDVGGTGVAGVRRQRAKAAAVEAQEEGRFWGATGGGGGGGVQPEEEEEDAARQGFQIGAVHLLKKQVRDKACEMGEG